MYKHVPLYSTTPYLLLHAIYNVQVEGNNGMLNNKIAINEAIRHVE